MNAFSITIWVLTAFFYYLSTRAQFAEITAGRDGSSNEEFALFGMFRTTTLLVTITIILYIIQFFLLK